MTIKAVYKGGTFRPMESVGLPDGAEVEMQVVSTTMARPIGFDAVEMAEFLSTLANLPIHPDGETFTNQDHDRILYGWKNKR
jgi:predicted DNA-binding antitoxin AbrB/MazE fold protein